MKKEWINPQLIQLSVDNTQGGIIYEDAPDGDPYFDEVHKCWVTPHGHS